MGGVRDTGNDLEDVFGPANGLWVRGSGESVFWDMASGVYASLIDEVHAENSVRARGEAWLCGHSVRRLRALLLYLRRKLPASGSGRHSR